MRKLISLLINFIKSMFFLTILDTFDNLKNKANYITYFIKYQKHLHSISLISKFN